MYDYVILGLLTFLSLLAWDWGLVWVVMGIFALRQLLKKQFANALIMAAMVLCFFAAAALPVWAAWEY